MLFSERYGYKKVKMLKKDEMPDHLRTRIWNVFYNYIFSRLGDPAIQIINDRFDPVVYEFFNILWDKHLDQNMMTLANIGYKKRVKIFYEKFYTKMTCYEIYDFIEFFAGIYPNCKTKDNIVAEIDYILKSKKTPYRFAANKVIPNISDEEISEIEKALNIPEKYKPVNDHYLKALEFFSKRPEAEYKNSISESIKAVESLVQIVLAEKGTLSELINNLNIHPAMRKGFEKLYSWTSNDSGIRHGEYGESFPCDEPEARYMLITCSAFINYVIAKNEKPI